MVTYEKAPVNTPHLAGDRQNAGEIGVPETLERFSLGWDQVTTVSEPAANIFGAKRV
jgi:hypothetical protein